MDLRFSNDEAMAVDLQEWDLVARLLDALAPDEGGRYPGAQLSRHRSDRRWTLTDGTVTVEVSCDGSIPGLGEPVWMTARAVWLAAWTAEEDGPFCRVTVEDRRREDGTVTAVVTGDGHTARLDLPDRDPMPTLRPPDPDSVLATATTDLRALRHVTKAAALSPTRVPLSGPPVGTFGIDRDALVLTGTDRRGVDRAAQLRLLGDVRSNVSPAIDVQLRIELSPLLCVLQELPDGEVTVTLTSAGELWLFTGACRVVLPGALRQLDPLDSDGIVYLAGHVVGTGEAVLSLSGDCPTDGTVVWLESAPDDYEALEWFEQHHDVEWYAEPEPYGVSTVDD